MKIIETPIEQLKPYENNPRNNENAVEAVKNSINEFGFKVPIIVDKDGVIVAGHTRYEAAKELGMDSVPCIVADDLTPKQIKAFRIADNKTGEKSTWDDELLGKELEEIMGDFDMTDFGFGDFELTVLTEDMTPEPFDKDIEEEYEPLEEKFLKNERVIITYSSEQKDDLSALLGVDLDKVTYKAEELLR